jgi:DNA-directed RNA polymerase specialized sigma24 family protein
VGAGEQVSLNGVAITPESPRLDVVALDNALKRFAVKHERKAAVVELRFFAGLSLDEAASILGVTRPTVARDWSFARAWLLAELSGDRSHGR